MFLTESYNDDAVMPPHIRQKYVFLESGSAAAVIKVVSPDEWNDILSVLEEFELNPQSWLKAGANDAWILKQPVTS